MTTSSAQFPARSRRRPLGRYMPFKFGQTQRWRFRRDRVALYLGRINGEVLEHQKSLIDAAIELEWSAMKAEHEGGLVAYREGRQLRVELTRVLAAFERSIVAQKPDPADQRKLLNDYLERRLAEEAA
jgi:hypothetical protein